MKKVVTLIAIAIAGVAYAQPNIGMENWSTYPFSTIEDPTGYVTANVLKVLDGANPLSGFKVTAPDINGGTYALKLETVDLVNNPDPATIPDPYHFCFTGNVDLITQTLNFGYPYTARPANFNFYSKYTPVGGDSAYCWVVLQKWNGTSRDTVAVGFNGWVGASTSYSLKTAVMIYYPAFTTSGFPDTCVIAFSSSADLTPQVGSALYVDDLSFVGWNGISEINSSVAVSAFPNPATESIMISTESVVLAEVIVYDGIGRTIGRYEMNSGATKIDTTKFRAGEYHFSMLDKDKKVLSGGSFNVVK